MPLPALGAPPRAWSPPARLAAHTAALMTRLAKIEQALFDPRIDLKLGCCLQLLTLHMSLAAAKGTRPQQVRASVILERCRQRGLG